MKMEVFIEGEKSFVAEFSRFKQLAKIVDDFITEVGVGDGSLRVFLTAEENDDGPDMYVINSDGIIHGEGHIIKKG
mgnify:CR=1 FL=1